MSIRRLSACRTPPGAVTRKPGRLARLLAAAADARTRRPPAWGLALVLAGLSLTSAGAYAQSACDQISAGIGPLRVAGLNNGQLVANTDTSGNTVVSATFSASTLTNDATRLNGTDGLSVIRYQDPAPSTVGTSVSHSISFNRAVSPIIQAGSKYSGFNSNMDNNADSLTFTAVNPSAGFSWQVDSGVVNANITNAGATITIVGPAFPGNQPLSFAQFSISASGTATGLNVSWSTIKADPGLNSAQYEIRLPSCRPRLTVVKNVTNDNGGTGTAATFGLNSTAGTLTFGGNTGTAQNAVYTATALNVNPGTYTLRENDIGNYTEGAWACTGATSGGGAFNAGSVTLANLNDATCSITNNDIALPTLRVLKQSIGGVGTFAYTGTNGYSGDSVTTTAPNTYVNGNVRTLSAVGVQTTVTETAQAGWAVDQDTNFRCWDDRTGAQVVGQTFSNGTFTIPAASVVAGSQFRCHYINRRLPTVRVTKISNGGTGTFGFSGSNGIANHNITTTASGGAGTAGALQTLTAAGVQTTITEGAPPAGYTLASITCTGLGAGGTATPSVATRTMTLDAAATAAGSNIACTFTNQASAGVTLQKAWTNGKANDAVSLTIGGGSGATGGSSVVGGISTNATATANTGATVTLTEAFTTGVESNYTTTLACTDANNAAVAVTGTGLSRTITMPGTAVTCTYTNSRIAQQVNLAKSWGAGASNGHTAGATTTGGTNNASFSSTAPSTGTTGTAVTMYAGDAVTLPAETFGGGATAANYGAAVACAGGTTLASATPPQSITVAASATATTCTYTNTPATGGVTLKKTWTNGKVDDAVSLTIAGGSGAAGGSSVAGGASTDATATANIGATVTLTEAFTTGAAGNYTTTLACTDANNATVAVTGTGLSRTITMPATAVTCTYTNSRIAQQVNLAKTWGAGASNGHTAGATTTGGTNNATFNSTAPATNTTGTGVTMYAGDVITLPAETFGGGATAANYTVALECTGGSVLTNGAAGRQLTIAANTTATTCRYTNTVATAGVTLRKTWTNGKANDAVSLTIAGGSGATGGSSVAGGASTDATATANNGTTVTLTEAFTTGAAGNYTTTLACTDANNAAVAVAVTGTGLSRTITMPATAVTCIYTNSRIAQQLNLAKRWSTDATSGHTAAATTTGGTANPTFSSTAPTATTGTAVTVYAGDAVALPVETFGGGATAANYGATVACTGGTTLASATPPQSITVAASTTATTCTYTNTLNSADLAVVKTNDATSVVGGGTTTYSVTVSNRGAAAVTGAVVSDTPVAGLSACQVTACTPGGACPAQPSDLLAAGGATLGTLAAGAQAVFTVTCNVNP